MVLSKFNQMLFEFACECGEVTKEVLSNLDGVATHRCPACRAVTDIEADPWRTNLADLRDIASELDKQAVQRGEILERIK